MDILSFGVFLRGAFGLDQEGMGTEVIPLSLEEVSWQVVGAISVVEAERRREGRSRDTPQSGLANDITPSGLSFVDGLGEEVVKQQIFEFWVVAVCVGDVLQEDGANNATTTPHQRNGWLVQLPVVFFGGLHNSVSITP